MVSRDQDPSQPGRRRIQQDRPPQNLMPHEKSSRNARPQTTSPVLVLGRHLEKDALLVAARKVTEDCEV